MSGRDDVRAARAEVEEAYEQQVLDPDGLRKFRVVAERVLPVFEAAGDHASLAFTWKAIARAAAVGGRADEMRGACRRSLEHAARAGGDEPYVRYLLLTALLDGSTPVDEAIVAAESALRDAGSPAVETGALWVLAECRGMRGELDAARAHAARLGALFLEAGRPPTALAGIVELLAGEPAAAERAVRPVYETHRVRGDVGHGAGAAAVLARAVLLQGRAEEALALTHEIEAWSSPEARSSEIAWRSLRALALGDPALGREAVQLADETEWTSVQARARLDLAHVADAAEARAVAEEARRLFEAKGDLVGAQAAMKALSP